MNNKIPKATRRERSVLRTQSGRATGIWLSMLLINVAMAVAQVEGSGLFGSTAGISFLTLGIFIIIIFFIGQSIIQAIKKRQK